MPRTQLSRDCQLNVIPFAMTEARKQGAVLYLTERTADASVARHGPGLQVSSLRKHSDWI